MPYKHVIKVSDEIYEKLWELTRKHKLESPNQFLEMLLAQGVTPSQTDRVTPSVEVLRRDYFWWTIRVGEGFNTIEISLNNMQLEKLCRARLLAHVVCKEAGFI
ncbi:MAG: hypothetical protein LM558_04710 [Thermosphaera sp.]|nr:hypothetical protein [Thermosphaera sp.]